MIIDILEYEIPKVFNSWPNNFDLALLPIEFNRKNNDI
jgi:hypothetical protein